MRVIADCAPGELGAVATDAVCRAIGTDSEARAELRALLSGKAADSRTARVAHMAYWIGARDGAELARRLPDGDRL